VDGEIQLCPPSENEIARRGKAHYLSGGVTGPARKRIKDPRPDVVETHAVFGEEQGGETVVDVDQAKQEMLGADVVVLQLARFVNRFLNDALGFWSKANLAAHQDAVASPDLALDGRAHAAQIDADGQQDRGGHVVGLLGQSEEKMLGPKIIVSEALRLILRHAQGSSRRATELVEAIRDV
jgi:hypothetical protein